MRSCSEHPLHPSKFSGSIQIPGARLGQGGAPGGGFDATKRGTNPKIHPWVTDFETKTIRGEACLRAALALKRSGFHPDMLIAHPGWGESLFLKEVWPQARIGIFCEFFYHAQGFDVGFDPEFPTQDLGDACRIRLKNLNNLLHFEFADAGISPTAFQADTFPKPFRDRISVIHDGIDTEEVRPLADAELTLSNASGHKFKLTRDDELVTFVNRNMEPYRGYHVFMRALPKLLKDRPNARVLVVGGKEVSYGAKPDPKKYGERSWHQIYLDEVRPQISASDLKRVHFLGNVAYPQFLTLLQLSRVHVYLTYPFVLSWSLIEAMSTGCAIVASDTAPVREVIEDDVTGKLVDFFDSNALAVEIGALLEDKARAKRYGLAARAHAVTKYDLKSVCLPAQMAWVNDLMTQEKVSA